MKKNRNWTGKKNLNFMLQEKGPVRIDIIYDIIHLRLHWWGILETNIHTSVYTCIHVHSTQSGQHVRLHAYIMKYAYSFPSPTETDEFRAMSRRASRLSGRGLHTEENGLFGAKQTTAAAEYDSDEYVWTHDEVLVRLLAFCLFVCLSFCLCVILRVYVSLGRCMIPLHRTCM